MQDSGYPWQDTREGSDRRAENRRKYERRSFRRFTQQPSESATTPINPLSNLLTQEEREFIEYLSRSEEELDLLP